MQIFVKATTTMVFNVSKNTTALSLIQMIADRIGTTSFYLRHGPTPIFSLTSTIGDYNIHENATLWMTPR